MNELHLFAGAVPGAARVGRKHAGVGGTTGQGERSMSTRYADHGGAYEALCWAVGKVVELLEKEA